MSNPYTILGVPKNASDADIKSAYRKLAKQHHPDVNKGNPESEKKFSKATTAYEILSDKTKRGQFDRGEIDGEGKQKFSGFGGAHPGGNPFGQGRANSGFSGINPDDILNEIFGGRRGGFGGGAASGMGAGHPGARHQGYASQKAQPKRTDISAKVPVNIAMEGGRIAVELPSGKSIRVGIPKGVSDGQQIRVTDNDTQIYITVHIVSGGGYRLEGSQLYYDLPITLYEAVLGATVSLETPAGQLSIKIQPGTTGDKTLRLREKGLILDKSEKRGDMYVVPRIILPEDGIDELKTLMEFWRDNKSYAPRG